MSSQVPLPSKYPANEFRTRTHPEVSPGSQAGKIIIPAASHVQM